MIHEESLSIAFLNFLIAFIFTSYLSLLYYQSRYGICVADEPIPQEHPWCAIPWGVKISSYAINLYTQEYLLIFFFIPSSVFKDLLSRCSSFVTATWYFGFFTIYHSIRHTQTTNEWCLLLLAYWDWSGAKLPSSNLPKGDF